MNNEQYESEVLRTAGAIKGKWGLNLAAMGLAGETGELVDLCKKHIFHDRALDRDAVLKELGDVLWYWTLLRVVAGISFDEVVDANVTKLRARYPDGYSHAASVARADEKPGSGPLVRARDHVLFDDGNG